MTNIKIKQTDEKTAALAIAKSLPDFFNEGGLASLEKDLVEHKLYGAFAAEELVGFIALRPVDTASLEISWLAVRPDQRRRGIGLELVKRSLGDFAAQGYRVAYVKTLAETIPDPGYDGTRAFYKKLGFCTLEIINPYPGWAKDNPCQILAAALPLK